MYGLFFAYCIVSYGICVVIKEQTIWARTDTIRYS